MSTPADLVVTMTAEQLRELVEGAVRRALATMGPQTLSTEEAAALAKRTPKTVRAWTASGALPSTKRGKHTRIRRDDLERFLAGGAPPEDPIVTTLKRG